MASIILKNINKSFRNSTVIKNVNLTIEDGECVVLVGPSGCGKSTILRMICGLEDIDSGEVFIGNRCVNNVPPANRGIAMVFQSYALYPHMTVFENMAFALQVRKLKKDEIEKRVNSTAQILKIDHLLGRKPKELSGGQKQRVAIGRAIVRNPYAFLFDEPLSNLDYSLRCQMRYELAKLKVQLNTTMIYVTHDQAEAMTLADKIVIMRDGSVAQVGTPLELYNFPVNTFVAKFIGSSEMNIFPLLFVHNEEKSSAFKTLTEERVSLRLMEKFQYDANKKYYLGIRPEDIEMLMVDDATPSLNKLYGTVVLAENLGGEEFVHVALKNGIQVTVKTRKTAAKLVGSDIRLEFSMDNCYLFDEYGNTIFGIEPNLKQVSAFS